MAVEPTIVELESLRASMSPIVACADWAGLSAKPLEDGSPASLRTLWFDYIGVDMDTEVKIIGNMPEDD